MKTYIINHDCIFNERKYELRNITNSMVIRMTAMRARCLSFIIEHAQSDVIERQELTTALWGSRGNFVNDANLTQILYLIRKDLKSFGINDLLITIPRKGIQVNDLIPIEAAENDLQRPPSFPLLTRIKRRITTFFHHHATH